MRREGREEEGGEGGGGREEQRNGSYCVIIKFSQFLIVVIRPAFSPEILIEKDSAILK